MKRLLLGALVAAANAVITLAGALALVSLFDLLPMNLPYSVQMFLSFILRVICKQDMDNADDMAMLAFLLYLTISVVIVGAIVVVGNVAMRRYLAKRRANG